ncbi:hypothetical protein GCM10020000_53080 [Streptomyces olivoverticillatus]
MSPIPDGELTGRYGSPLYVYDLDRVTAARDALYAALPDGFTLFYSLKANPHPGIVRALREGDRPCRAEVCSTGELASALEAGHEPAAVLYSGPGKTAAEMAVALDAGVRTFSVESPGDLRRLGAVAHGRGIRAQVLIRVNSAAAAATTSIRMTGTPSQFGFDAEGLPEVLPELLAVPGVEVVGAHFFPLSNSKDEDSLIAEFEATIASAARLEAELGLPLRMLDIGGGFAAPYSVPGERPVYGRLRAALEKALDEHLPRWRQGGIEIACESGRYLVGVSGRLLTTVTNVKESRGRTFAILDAGINTLGGMAQPGTAAAAGRRAPRGGRGGHRERDGLPRRPAVHARRPALPVRQDARAPARRRHRRAERRRVRAHRQPPHLPRPSGPRRGPHPRRRGRLRLAPGLFPRRHHHWSSVI